MSCLKGGFIHQRHDEMRDFLAQATSEVCNDVMIEPKLLETTGEEFHRSANTHIYLSSTSVACGRVFFSATNELVITPITGSEI